MNQVFVFIRLIMQVFSKPFNKNQIKKFPWSASYLPLAWIKFWSNIWLPHSLFIATLHQNVFISVSVPFALYFFHFSFFSLQIPILSSQPQSCIFFRFRWFERTSNAQHQCFAKRVDKDFWNMEDVDNERKVPKHYSGFLLNMLLSYYII